MTLYYIAAIAAFASFLLWILFGWRSDLEARLVANRRIPYWIGGTWMAVAFTWGTTYLYTASLSYSQGIIGFSMFAFGNTMGLVLAMWLSARIPTPEKKYSLPEAMAERYGVKTGKLYAWSIIAIQTLYAISLQFIVVTLVMKNTVGADPVTVIVASAAVMLVLMAMGGIQSSLALDILKVGMIASLIVFLAPYSIENAGGLSAIIGGLSGATGTPGAGGSMLAFVLGTGIPIIVSLVTAGPIDQSLYQRFFSVRRGPRVATIAFMIVGVTIFVLNMVASGALGSLAANPELGVVIAKGQEGIAGFIAMQKFAPIVAPFFILTILASFIASGDTALNASTSVFVKDVIQPKVPHWSEGKLRVVQILAAAVFILPGAFLAYKGASMLALIVVVGVFRAAFLFPTVFAFTVSKERLPDVFGVIAFSIATSAVLFGAGKACAVYGCTLPGFSPDSYMLAGSLAGWVITGVYCSWRIYKNGKPAVQYA